MARMSWYNPGFADGRKVVGSKVGRFVAFSVGLVEGMLVAGFRVGQVVMGCREG